VSSNTTRPAIRVWPTIWLWSHREPSQGTARRRPAGMSRQRLRSPAPSESDGGGFRRSSSVASIAPFRARTGSGLRPVPPRGQSQASRHRGKQPPRIRLLNATRRSLRTQMPRSRQVRPTTVRRVGRATTARPTPPLAGSPRPSRRAGSPSSSGPNVATQARRTNPLPVLIFRLPHEVVRRQHVGDAVGGHGQNAQRDARIGDSADSSPTELE